MSASSLADVTNVVASCPHSSGLRPPTRDTAVHKDECTQCFDDDTAPDGLTVCLTCFNGGCSTNHHYQRHYTITRHPLILNIHKQETQRPAQQPADTADSGAQEPPTKITKLAIGVPGGVQLSDIQPYYSYRTRVFCLACAVQIKTEDDSQRQAELQALEESKKEGSGSTAALPQKSELDALIDTVLLHTAASAPATTDSAWAGETPTPCEHTLTLVQQSVGGPVGAKGKATCAECELTSNLWLCMTCGLLHCGRAYADGTGGKGHAVAHHKASQHPLVVKTGTISAEGTADVYCYACDNTKIDDQLAAHMHTFGIDIASETVTEKSTAEMELQLNIDHNWSVVLNEGGTEAALRYGPGYAGLRNLGNSCYLASVVQVLFHLPPFHRRYWVDGQRHINECRNGRPADCFACQMVKVGDGIYSGRYAVVPSEEQLDESRKEREAREAEKERARQGTAMDVDKPQDSDAVRRKKQLQAGIPPRMFKRLVAKGHSEFSGSKQQVSTAATSITAIADLLDALEFWHYFLSQVQQKEHTNKSDPTNIFSFKLQDRLECSECHGVRYSSVSSSELSLPIPLPEPLPPTQPADGGKQGKPEDKQYPPTPLEACFQAWHTKTAIEGYRCPRCQRATTAWSTPSFLTFPNHLVLVMRRFLFDSWVPTKLDAPVNPVYEMQIEQYKGTGLQAGEQELPAEGGAGAAASAPVADAGIVSQLEGMGFSANAASRAALAVSNSDGEAAMNWLLAHMEDADINSPLPTAAAAASTSSSSGPAPPADLVEQLASMGFDQARCVYALQQTSNSLDRAVEWLFSHADDPLPSASAPSSSSSVAASSSSAPAAAGSDAGSGSYRLYAAITHLGKSTSTGHYVCHLRGEDGKWALFNDEKVSQVDADESGVGKGMDRAYMLIYQRVD